MLDGEDYRRVFAQNFRVSNRCFTVLAHCHKQPKARLGLAVARKRARKASDRNRIKRIVRESFRHRRGELGGLDVVVMNRDAASAARREELRAAIDQLWSDLSRKRREHEHAGKLSR